jgi:hypothetical protein
MTFNSAILDLIDGRVAAGAKRLTAVGTVVERTSQNLCTVTLDGSSLAVPVKVLGDVNALPGRRACLVKFGSDWVVAGVFGPTGLIAYAERPSSSSGTTTEVEALRLGSVGLIAGFAYRVWSSSMIIDSTVATDDVGARYRATFDGSDAAIGSAVFSSSLDKATGAAGQVVAEIMRSYIPAANETLSVLLTVFRAVGTGTVNLTRTAGFPIDIHVECLGLAPANTGVPLP